MLRFVLAVIALGLVAAQRPRIHNVCHDNPQFSEAQVIHLLSSVCDRNHDGTYSEAEVVVGFAEILGQALPFDEQTILTMNYDSLKLLATIGGFALHRADFVASWHATFYDSLTFAGAYFDAFDDNGNGVWSITEVDGVLRHIKNYFDNGDGIINHAEFEAFFKDLRGATCYDFVVL